MFWIISYDIPDNKRRSKVAKILEGYGIRAQYSVFECEIDSEKCDQLEHRLQREIDPQVDDIRFYPLNRADIKRVRMLGRGKLNRKQRYHIIGGDPDHPF